MRRTMGIFLLILLCISSLSAVGSRAVCRSAESIPPAVMIAAPAGASAPANAGSGHGFWYFFFMDLHLIGLIYTVPILIFRFLVIRRPIEKKKSLHIVIVHGIIVFLVIFLLENAPDSGMSGTNGAVIPWSFVNYWILTFGLKKKEETWKASAQICGQCGAHLPQNVRICDQCGARLQQDRRRFR